MDILVKNIASLPGFPLHSEAARPVVVECVGLPGSGKTTSCHYFAGQLRAAGYRVLLIADIKAQLRAGPVPLQVWWMLRLVWLRGKDLIRFGLLLRQQSVLTIQAVRRYLRIALYEQVLRHRLNKEKADVVLLEQWMIQELWSATIFKALDHRVLEERLARLCLPVDILIYFDISESTATERVGQRTHGRSRFDRLPASIRLSAMEKYGQFLEQLFRFAPCAQKHVLSASQSPGHNFPLLCRYLSFYQKKKAAL